MIHKSDVDRLRQLAAFFKPLADLPPLLDALANAEQASREASERMVMINAECLAAAEKRDEAEADLIVREGKMTERESHAKERIAKVEESAILEAQNLVDNAQAKAADIRSDADSYAEKIKKDAATIDRAIASKRAEVEKIEGRLHQAQEKMRKMLAATGE